MNTSISRKILPRVLTAAETYDYSAGLIARLAAAHVGFQHWWTMLAKPTDTRIAFDDRASTVDMNSVGFITRRDAVSSLLHP
ncbi:hypothetical protein ACLB90_11930 [Stenotrophomonas sp. LGBM10]|uniref:hypothetical protein n=1 Tax=Stenotrophomonas sp. LGBM10 TaxID=3390038 RepID=UPI00398A62E5